MSRAHADVRHKVALALALYLSDEYRVDSNPSGHAPRPEQKQIAHELPNEVGQPDEDERPDEGTPALVPDLDYGLRDASLITGNAEVTLRKWISKGKLPARKGAKNRVLVRGKDLAKIMAQQINDTPTGGESAPEG